MKPGLMANKAFLFTLLVIWLVFNTCQVWGQTLGDYRSIGSGNWNAPGSWEYYNGTSWVNPATTYPGQNTGTHDVTIRNGHNITLNVDVTNSFDSLIVTGVDAGNRSTLIAGNNNADRTLNTLKVLVTNYGQIIWNENSVLKLPCDAILTIDNNGRLYPYGNDCNSNAEKISICGKAYACCKGGGCDYSFSQINEISSCTLQPILTTNSPVCAGGTISLTCSYSGSLGKTVSEGVVTGATFIVTDESTTVCSGTLTPLAGSANCTYNGSVGTHTLTLTETTFMGNYQCQDAEIVIVTVNALPSVSLTAAETSGTTNNDNIICAGANVTFTATAGFTNYNFKVNGSSVQDGGSNSYSTTSLTNGASVTVDVTNSNICTATFGPVVITVNALPSGSLAATESSGTANNDNIICAWANVTFTATAGFTNYNFKVNGSSVQNGGSNSYSTTSLTNGASVTVDVTNSNNCTATFGPVVITVNPLPTTSAIYHQ